MTINTFAGFGLLDGAGYFDVYAKPNDFGITLHTWGAGSGFDITIPSVLMFKQDADPIKEQLKKKKTVRIELQWSLPNPDDHVEWDLWTSPTDTGQGVPT